jgi:hypothetical protein
MRMRRMGRMSRMRRMVVEGLGGLVKNVRQTLVEGQEHAAAGYRDERQQ